MLARPQLWIQVAVLALLGCWLAATPADAQTERNLVTVNSVRVGIGGVCKSGFWAPIWLDLVAGPRGASGTLEIIVPDGNNVPVIYSEPGKGDLSLGPNQEATILRYAKLGRENGSIHLQIRQGEQTVWSQELSGLPARLAATQELVVGIGADLNLKQAVASIRRSPELALSVIQVQSAAELPDQWLGYEGVDRVVLATGDARLREAITSDQREALFQWLRLGGRLVVTVGSGGNELAAEGSPWKPILPGKLVEVSALRDRAGLEAFAGVELPWEDDEFQRTRPQVTRLSGIDGTAILDEIGSGTDRPLIIRAAHGLGEVTFIGVDLDHPGFAKWPGRPKLLASILAGSRGRADDHGSDVRRGIGHLGYDDLIGQLRAALDQFPGVTLVSFTTVSVLTALYLLLIGPGDFLFLSRLKIPRHVTWITFALIAVAFAATAWLVGRATHGDRVRVNQLEIVDFDAQTGTVRGTGWAHLYSPSTARYSIAAQPNLELLGGGEIAGVLTWQGLPGDSLGGLRSNQRALAETEPYHVRWPDQPPEIDGLPVQSASSKSLSVRWWGQCAKPTPSSLIVNEYGALDGELNNPLPVELTECLIVFKDSLYRVGPLKSGQAVDLGSLTPRNLQARLTEVTFEGSKEVSTLWKRDSNDVARIVQMLMFHEAARGRSYTGLTHRYQPYLDLSSHLDLGRAVLAGQADQPATRLTGESRDLAPGDDTTAGIWFRVVFPVQMQPIATSQP